MKKNTIIIADDRKDAREFLELFFRRDYSDYDLEIYKTGEEVENRLIQAQRNLVKFNTGEIAYIRLLGAMEMALVLLGKINVNGQLPYKTYTQDIGFFKTRLIERTESYSRMIQRECFEYFDSKEKM